MSNTKQSMLSDIILGLLIYGTVLLAVIVSIPPVSFFTLFVPSVSPTISRQIKEIKPTMTISLHNEKLESLIEYTVGYSIIISYLGAVFSISFTGGIALIYLLPLPSSIVLFSPVGLFIIFIAIISQLELEVNGRMRSHLHMFAINFLEQKYRINPDFHRDGASIIVIGLVFTVIVLLILYYIAGLVGLVLV